MASAVSDELVRDSVGAGRNAARNLKPVDTERIERSRAAQQD